MIFSQFSKVQNILLSNISKNKLHHALIFSGIKGIGKSKFSLDLAKKVTNNYSEIENNPNILYIRKTLNQKKELRNNIVIDDVRKIKDFMNLTPSISKNRVVIIDAIEDLNIGASNSLLKNLEEPTDNVCFFLINHNKNQILDTIKSRCISFKMNPPSYEVFLKIIKSNTLNIADLEVKILHQISSGSIGVALDLYQANIIEYYKRILQLSLSSSGVNKFIDDLIKIDKELTIFSHLVSLLFIRVIKFKANLLEDEFFNNEIIFLKEIADSNSINAIFIKYDKAKDILLKLANFNLDKKQSIINVINII